jgi:hypothetical protein
MKNKIMEIIKKEWFPIMSVILYLSVLLLEFILPGGALQSLSCGADKYFNCLVFFPFFDGFFSISFVSIVYLIFSVCCSKWVSEVLFASIRRKTRAFLFIIFLLSFASSLYLGYFLIFKGSVDENLLSGISEWEGFFSGFSVCVLYVVYLIFGYLLEKTKLTISLNKNWYALSAVIVLIPTSVFFMYSYSFHEDPGSFGQGGVLVRSPDDNSIRSFLAKRTRLMYDEEYAGVSFGKTDYNTILAPRAIPVSVVGWLFLNFVSLLLLSPIVNRLKTYRQKHKKLSVFFGVVVVPLVTLVLILISLFIPSISSVLTMGASNETCGGFLCFNFGPIFTLLGGWLVLSVVNTSLFLRKILKNEEPN